MAPKFWRSVAMICLLILVSMMVAGCGGGGEDEAVRIGNSAPDARAGNDQTVEARTTVTLDGSGSSDRDGSIVAYRWTQTSGPSVTLTNADAIRTTFQAPEVTINTTFAFQLWVQDDSGDSDMDMVRVTVTNIEDIEIPETQQVAIVLDPGDLNALSITADELEIVNFADDDTGQPATAMTAVWGDTYSTLLTAEGSGGTVFISLKLPQSGTGTVEGNVDMGVEQTVLALTLLLIGNMDDQEKAALVPTIQAYPEFAETVAELRRLQQRDPYVLERIADFPEVVDNLMVMAEKAFDTYLAQLMAEQNLNQQSRFPQVTSDGDDVNVPGIPVTISPFSVFSPWRYSPGRNWFWYIHPDDWRPINPLSITQAPFMAESTDVTGVLASGNPSQIVYAIEFYDAAGELLGAELIGRNSSLTSKTLSSGAARGLNSEALPSGTKYVRMVKWGTDVRDSTAGSLLTISHYYYTLTTVISLLSSSASQHLHNVDLRGAACVAGLAAAFDPTLISSFNWANILPQVESLFESSVLECFLSVAVKDASKEVVGGLVGTILAEIGIKASNPAGWMLLIFNSLNEAAPFASSMIWGQREALYEVILSNDGSIESVTSRAAITPAVADLGIRDFYVNDSSGPLTVNPGDTLTLEVLVANVGLEDFSGSADVRYYRSTDRSISSADERIGTDETRDRGIASGEFVRESLDVEASGTYYYGACVEVDGETKTANNCSASVEVVVTDDGEEGAFDGPWRVQAGSTLPGCIVNEVFEVVILNSAWETNVTFIFEGLPFSGSVSSSGMVQGVIESWFVASFIGTLSADSGTGSGTWSENYLDCSGTWHAERVVR